MSFLLDFDTETQLVGYPSVHLRVEARGADDMDLFVLVQKLDANGTTLEQFTTPNRSALAQDVTQRGASVLRYKGSNGRLRVSARHLDPARSTEEVPAHSFDRIEKLAPGEVVEVDIDLFPLGMAFSPGQQLRLVISSRNELGTIMPGQRDFTPLNTGQHVIHTGGPSASYLRLPVMAAPQR